MMILKLLLVIGLLAAFFPYTGKSGEDSKAKGDSRKEKKAYLIMAGAGVGLSVLHQLGWYPEIAQWIDEGMEFLFRFAGSSQV